VGLVEAGSTRFTLCGASYAASPGQLVVIGPGLPHACNPDTASGISYRMFYLAPGWLAGASPGGAPPRFATPVLDDPALFALFTELYDALYEALVPGAGAGDRQALLMTALGLLVARHATVPEPDGQDGQKEQARPQSAAVAKAREHLAANVGSFVPLGELARTAGLSPHHFLRVFKAATGLPPHAYQIQQAVENAKRLLAGGAPISQTALEAGFADQSHFSRIFRELTGATPRQYLTGGGEPTAKGRSL
jgi:AraC-like DNA-binding protein